MFYKGFGMGKHLDAAVEALNNKDIWKDQKELIIKDDPSRYALPQELYTYLYGLIRASKLFEVPVDPRYLLDMSGKTEAEYDKYIANYLTKSQNEAGVFLATPFPITAVEDTASVTILDPRSRRNFNEFIVSDFVKNDDGSLIISVGHVEIEYDGKSFPANVIPLYEAILTNKRKFIDPLQIILNKLNIPYQYQKIRALQGNLSKHESKIMEVNLPPEIPPAIGDVIKKNLADIVTREQTHTDRIRSELKKLEENIKVSINRGYQQSLLDSTTSYIQEIIQIMDPKVFIVCEKTREYRNAERISSSKKNKNFDRKLKKTIVRKKYHYMNKPQAQKFFSSDKDGYKRSIHAVIGHWRDFPEDSEYFVNKRGGFSWVQQHWRGEGSIEDTRGHYYEVLIKDRFGKLTPFSEYKQSK